MAMAFLKREYNKRTRNLKEGSEEHKQVLKDLFEKIFIGFRTPQTGERYVMLEDVSKYWDLWYLRRLKRGNEQSKIEAERLFGTEKVDLFYVGRVGFKKSNKGIVPQPLKVELSSRSGYSEDYYKDCIMGQTIINDGISTTDVVSTCANAISEGSKKQRVSKVHNELQKLQKEGLIKFSDGGWHAIPK